MGLEAATGSEVSSGAARTGAVRKVAVLVVATAVVMAVVVAAVLMERESDAMVEVACWEVAVLGVSMAVAWMVASMGVETVVDRMAEESLAVEREEQATVADTVVV